MYDAVHSGKQVRLYLALAVWCLLLSSPAAAQPGKEKDPLSWDRNVSRLVQRYCVGCHNQQQMRGGVNLAQDEDPRQIWQHHETWETARDLIEGEEMPPDEARQPSAKDRALLVEFLTLMLDSRQEDSAPDPGKPTLRRLNRVEYDNSIADLTGLDLHLGEGFPPDPSGFGFDNIGDALTLSPVQIDLYYRSALTVVDALLKAKDHQRSAYESIFWVGPGTGTEDVDAARQIVERFATRAFRRPVEPELVDRLMGIYDKSRSKGNSHESAVGHMLTAVLISPQFLLRLEHDRPESSEPYPIDDFELATRLSFFLWSRPPDETLFTLAREGALTTVEVLEAQTRRMLADPRSQALVSNFFGQWLGLREINSHQPDTTHFPQFDEDLRRAMRAEVDHLLLDMVRQDGPVTQLIDADYTYLNERLAAFYGIAGVTGQQMHRVALTDRRRGGLLTSAALLMLQSDPTRTNVPRRGSFIAGRILALPRPHHHPMFRRWKKQLPTTTKSGHCANCWNSTAANLNVPVATPKSTLWVSAWRITMRSAVGVRRMPGRKSTHPECFLMVVLSPDPWS